MTTTPSTNEELEAAAIDFLSSCDVDFGYAVGNLNMDTTLENRKELIEKLKSAFHSLLEKERAEAYKKGFIDGSIKS